MTFLRQLLRCSVAPTTAYIASTLFNTRNEKNPFAKTIASCEGNKDPSQSAADGSVEFRNQNLNIDREDLVNAKGNAIITPAPDSLKDSETSKPEELFHGMFPLRQLWKPKYEYPLWDDDWDGRKPESTGDVHKDAENNRWIRKHGVTRHIILVRHGQYDETHKEDEKRILTPLGRKQAALTGQRLAEMIKGINDQFDPCNVTTIRVSNMARAKETAEIISQYLPPHVNRADPDPNLNEGVPCPTVPGKRISASAIKKTDEGHKRIETAFQSYFYRAKPPSKEEENDSKKGENDGSTDICNVEDSGEAPLKLHPQHEFEIIVCHANVLRYFLTRALQIPPEAWLRLCTFNCSLTYITIRPTGTCSCRMLGDIGHLGYEHATFSMHHGFNW